MPFVLPSEKEFDVHALAEEFENASLDEVLAWCWSEFGDRAAIGTSFQGSGLVIIDHCVRAGLPLPVFTVDTGLMFPETVQLKSDLETFFNIKIESLHPLQSVDEQNRTMGNELWKSRPDTCCSMRKVMPLQAKLAKLDVWITGMRRQQSGTRKNTKILELYKFDESREEYLYKLNPMANWSREAVWEHLREKEIPYNPLHDRGYRSIGCWPCTKASGESQDERAGRWEGFEKTECGIHTFLGQNI
ncbi:MAG: phosphoadenosine phosphosulfate reductase [Pseudoalteromonas tetraodonis]|jgi:phosphoadenosine phosphosulfate reductase